MSYSTVSIDRLLMMEAAEYLTFEYIEEDILLAKRLCAKVLEGVSFGWQVQFANDERC